MIADLPRGDGTTVMKSYIMHGNSYIGNEMYTHYTQCVMHVYVMKYL